MSKKNVTEKNQKKIVVTGDQKLDWFEVIIPPSVSENEKILYEWQKFPMVMRFVKPGGALFLSKAIQAATSTKVLSPEIKNIGKVNNNEIINSNICLSKFPFSTTTKEKENIVYRVSDYKGFIGTKKGEPTFLAVKNDDANADIVVIYDTGYGFCETKSAWPAVLLEKGKKPYVIFKTSNPLAQNSFIEMIRGQYSDRLVVVINADDLRQAGVKISRRLSWERTAKDFVWQMVSNPNLIALNNCAYLIVRFGLDGVILYRRRMGVVESRLFFDPKTGEDGFYDLYPGKMLGCGSVFVAALTEKIVNNGLERIEEGVSQGFISSRRLWQLGFGNNPGKLDFPFGEVFKPFDESEFSLADVTIPNPTVSEPADPYYWGILDDLNQTSLEDVAYNFVINGKDSSLDKIPLGQFRNLRTFDRSEIESFRSVKNLIHEYISSSNITRPLSIAVFGPPGSGKSFGVTEVAESVAPGKLDKPLEFNLSQFNSAADLIIAFHKIRDIALGGKLPIVFFDEFDSDYNGKLGWLKYFLAPMNDGVFRDGETMHPIGRAIFVFAGGTCSTFKEFSKEEVDLDFKNVKGPDFVSRLRGYVNIKGPNPLNKDENLYMIRRAQVLRFLLQKNAANIFERKKCCIDSGVLRALIKIPEYKHGIRSMLAIIEMSMLAGRKTFEQAALPSPEQLRLHVDDEIFSRLVVRDVLLGSAREVLAKAIHQKFLKDNKGKIRKNDRAMVTWAKLSEDLKETNRQQADHIPEKLRAVGCNFTPVLNEAPKFSGFTPNEIEIMAEMEHLRWNKQKFLAGWSYGEKKDAVRKTHPCLVEWKNLSEKEKEKDRVTVREIPMLLKSAKFEIYRLKNK